MSSFKKEQTVPDNFMTHRDSWRTALLIARSHAVVKPPDQDSVAYWTHEINAFDRAYASLKVTNSQRAQSGESTRVTEVMVEQLNNSIILLDALSERMAAMDVKLSVALAASPAMPSIEPSVKFDDPRVQVVYDILCSEESPPAEEHWEGFVARRIVDALDLEKANTPVDSVDGNCNRVPDGVAFSDKSLAFSIEKTRRYLTHLANHKASNTIKASPYFYDDGYPRKSLAGDAAAALHTFEQLVETAANVAAEPEVTKTGHLYRDNIISGAAYGSYRRRYETAAGDPPSLAVERALEPEGWAEAFNLYAHQLTLIGGRYATSALLQEIAPWFKDGYAGNTHAQTYASALAELRDLFEPPQPGSKSEVLWSAAMGHPEEIPSYVKARVEELKNEVSGHTTIRDESAFNKELTDTAMRFVDRAVAVGPDIGESDTVRAHLHAAISSVVGKYRPMPLVETLVAPVNPDFWRMAVINAYLVTGEQPGCKNPVDTVNKLIDWHVQNERAQASKPISPFRRVEHPPLPEVSAQLYQAHWGMGIGFKANTVGASTLNQPKEGEYTIPGPLFTTAQMRDHVDADRAACEVPEKLDLTTKNGDLHQDTEYRRGWNACIDSALVVINEPQSGSASAVAEPGMGKVIGGASGVGDMTV